MYRGPLCRKDHNISCVWYVRKYCVTCLSTKNKFRVFPCNHMCCCRCMPKLHHSYIPLPPRQLILSTISTLQPELGQQSRLNQPLPLYPQQPPFLGPQPVFHETRSKEEFSSDEPPEPDPGLRSLINEACCPDASVIKKARQVLKTVVVSLFIIFY